MSNLSVVSGASHPHLAGIRRIYLSGPMTGLPSFNYLAFRAATSGLRGWGFEVYCPTERPGATGEVFDPTGFSGHERLDPDQFDLRAAFADYAAYIATEADAVAVLPGWENSRGAKAEVALAVAVGLPVIDAETLDLVEANLRAGDERTLSATMRRHPAGSAAHQPGRHRARTEETA